MNEKQILKRIDSNPDKWGMYSRNDLPPDDQTTELLTSMIADGLIEGAWMHNHKDLYERRYRLTKKGEKQLRDMED